MVAFFLLTAPMEDGGADTIYGVYTELKMLHTKVLEIMEKKTEKVERLVIAQLVDGKLTPILPVKNFDKVMRCLYEEIDENALREFIEDVGQDFIVAFLREIISPGEEPDVAQYKRYCEVLDICKTSMKEDMSLYKDICDAGIKMYSAEYLWRRDLPCGNQELLI